MKITSIQALDYVGLSASLPLENGVTTLVGANAAGKTMLVNIVPGILFNEAKFVSGAAAGFMWESDNGNGSIMVSKKGAKTTWRGVFDGKAKEHNTIKPAQKWLSSNFPVSSSVFVTANFLAAFRSGTMLAGLPAARKQLLSDIQGLQIFEDLRKGVNELAKSANLTLAMRERIEHELQELAPPGGAAPKVYLGGIASYLAEKRSDIKAEASALADALEDRPFGNIPTDILNQLLEIAPERNQAWDNWDEFQSDGGKPVKAPKAKVYRASLAAQEIYDSNPRNFDIVIGKVEAIFGADSVNAELLKVGVNLENIERQLEHMDGHEGDTCPTCGSGINGRKLIKSLRIAKDLLLVEHKQWQSKLQIAKASDFIKKVAKQHNVSLAAIAKVVGRYESVIEDYETAMAMKKRWGGEVPVKPEKPRIDMDELQAELRLRKRGVPLVSEGEKRYTKLTKKLQGATGVLAAVSELVEEQSEAIAAHKRRTALIQELSELPNADDAEILVELLKSLDNRNARDNYLELVAKHLIESMNELAPLFFQYKVEFAWLNGKLVANRKGAATDTALLSGREGRTFMLLNAIAVQQCLPPAKRLRTLFLDELEAGSSPENRALLAELIPSVLDYYDNICVVTPLAKSEFYIEGPRYCVVEDKGRKSLVREE